MTNSWNVQQAWAAEILPPFRTHLSLSQNVPLEEKDLLGTAHTAAGRLTADEHLARLTAGGQFTDRGQGLLLLSMRNVLSNLRCLGFVRGETPIPVGVT